MQIAFRPCRGIDVALLDQLSPSPSVVSAHAQRFARQSAGSGTYMLAWRRKTPVGHAEIRWDGCADETVKRTHPDCPEINGLEVFPETMRSRGIGSALVNACEATARDRNYRAIGLGVADCNPAALKLYRRLGYQGGISYKDRYTCIDSLGTSHDFADPCVFLVKSLS